MNARDVSMDKGLRHPVPVSGADGSTSHTVAKWNLGVGLAPEGQGGHMPRFAALPDAARGRSGLVCHA